MHGHAALREKSLGSVFQWPNGLLRFNISKAKNGFFYQPKLTYGAQNLVWNNANRASVLDVKWRNRLRTQTLGCNLKVVIRRSTAQEALGKASKAAGIKTVITESRRC